MTKCNTQLKIGANHWAQHVQLAHTDLYKTLIEPSKKPKTSTPETLNTRQPPLTERPSPKIRKPSRNRNTCKTTLTHPDRNACKTSQYPPKPEQNPPGKQPCTTLGP